MISIAILSHASIDNGGQNILFPLFRWKEQLNDASLMYTIYTDHNDRRIFNHPIVIILHRYYTKWLGNTIIEDKTPIIEFIEQIKNRGAKVILFDTGNTSGSRELDLLPYVDKLVKKQLFKNLEQYTLTNTEYEPVRIWSPKDETTSSYIPARQQDLSKIELAWNIGLTDYRNIPYISKLGHITNRIFWKPKISKVENKRSYITHFRGSISNKGSYAIQRNTLIAKLKELKNRYSILISSERVSKSKFFDELRSTKAIISPYGWGEICYRDFETFLCGSILIKPSLEHLVTFPNFFIKDKTYISTNWDFSNIDEIIDRIYSHYEQYAEIAESGQSRFLQYTNNDELFVNHFSKLINI